ncbi:MAG: lamin tail domain-containing protein, partial [Lewinella sp.]|nr:lamin tail domain-containing protein [Lewinella sp.]
FVNRFADHLNTTFAPARVERFIDSLYLQLLPEMPRHLARWRLNEDRWKAEVEQLRVFARKRPEYLLAYLSEFFEAGTLRDLDLAVTSGGQVMLNENLAVGREGLRGQYFANYPISLRAVPDYGHRFVGWEGSAATAEDRSLVVSLLANQPYRLRAVFEPFTHHLQDQVMINEVCAKNGDTGDWVEIHNASDETVQLEGWVLTDLQNEFIFPAVELLPNDYLVVCRDADRFREVFPEAYNVIGGLGYGVNKRHETLALYAGLGAAVDSFSYELPPLDTAFTLALLLPTLDNADPDNWELRLGNGTPCAPNPYYVESRIRGLQRDWMRLGLAGGVLLLSLLLLRLRSKGIF